MAKPKRAVAKETERKPREKHLEEIAAPENDKKNYMINFDMTVKQFTIASLRQKFKKGELDFNTDMQRGEVWNKFRASLYIHSLLLGLSPYQSPFLMNKRTNEDNTVTYEVLDGKQRGLPAIIKYLDNGYALCGLASEPNIIYNGKPYIINGLRFCQLPEELRKELESVGIPVAISFNATPEQKSVIFSRANNYKPMSKFDLARANKKDMSDIIHLASHKLFEAMCGDKRKKLDYHKLIVESWIVENEIEPIITSTHINKVMSELAMSEKEQDRLNRDYDKVLKAYQILLPDKENGIIKTIFNATHFLSYLSFVENFPDDRACAEWFKKFYSDIPNDYSETTVSQTNSTTNLKIRMNVVENSINEFLENYKSTVEISKAEGNETPEQLSIEE